MNRPLLRILPLALLLAAALASPAAAAGPSATFLGTTSSKSFGVPYAINAVLAGDEETLVITPDRRTLCADGTSLGRTGGFPVKVTAKGTFDAKVPTDIPVNGGQLRGKGVVTVKGRFADSVFAGGKLTGSFRDDLSLVDASGAVKTTCTSGNIRFTAAPGVLVGATKEGLPAGVTIGLDEDDNAIADVFRAGVIESSCSDRGTLKVAVAVNLDNFTDRSFSGTSKTTGTAISGGGVVKTTVKVTGAISRDEKRARAKLTATSTFAEPGKPVVRCTTPMAISLTLR